MKANIVGVLILLYSAAVLKGVQLSLLPTGYRAGFIVLLILGMTMCSLGPLGRMFEPGGTSDPIYWAAAALGTVGIVAAIVFLTGGRLPGVVGSRGAFIALLLFIMVKWAISTVHQFVKR